MTEKGKIILRLASGDVVRHVDNSLILSFGGRRNVLSTSVYGGGYREDLTAAWNLDMSRDVQGMAASSYEAYLRQNAGRLGLDPEHTTGMGTSAHMENAAVETLSYQGLTVTAISTGGIEANGGRVGDPAQFFQPCAKPCPGTINLMLFIDADLPPGTLARALVTCTEAKVAALQELMADSRYSSGLATGSGTDQTILVANPESQLCLDDAGKHSKLGELIGLTVIAAVKGGMEKQHGLTPERQHDLLRRLRRFGVTEETIWDACERLFPDEAVPKERFLAALRTISVSSPLLSEGALYVHLIDERHWGLLEEKETRDAALRILRELASSYGLSPPAELTGPYPTAMEVLLARIAHRQLQVEGQVI